MNKILLATILTLVNLQAKESMEINVSTSNKQYQFGKNINLIGTWKAIATKECCVWFIFGMQGASTDIRVKFNKNGSVYKVEKNKEILTDMVWSINNDGIVKVEKNDAYYENIGIEDATKRSIRAKMMKNIFKSIDTKEFKILSKTKGNCFMVQNDIELCKIDGKLHTDPDEVIQIEMH